jgi:predicted ATPase/DNA-binding SARP family transcriptional activator
VLEFLVLGPVEVRRDGKPVAIPGGKTAELLVHLALAAGTPVRADRLLDDLWSGTPTNRNTLQQKVARLRRSLGDHSLIAGGDDGYRLAIEPDAVDAHQVLRDVDTATTLFDEGEHAAAAAVSAAALALFRGDVLPSAGDWAAAQRARLEEARMQLMETRFATRLRLGEEVIGELEAAVATAPYREGLWELLITALYRGGRQADALAAYQRIRAGLANELGLEPGPRLKEIEQQILTQDQLLRPRAGNLPSLVTELIARDSEIAALGDLVAGHRLVEVVGPGGIGKTALAIATGGTLVDVPVWLVRLEAAQTADDVLDTVIAELGVVGGEAALQERLRGTGAVLILDNCEHVVDAVGALVERLLDATPTLRVLCTSQVPLGLATEAVFEVPPLRLEDAVELFARRSARPGDPDEVREVCRSLDGLPLAIELAAARTRTLSVEEIARRLDDRFTVLSDPTSRKPERRRALRATIGWSYDLLFPDDQRGLWALATFPGGASLAAAESVLGALGVPAAAAMDVVSRLASRSLVIVDQPPRYRLLDSIRAFALEALADAGLNERGFAAHAAWYAEQAASSTDGVRGARQAEHLAFARAERANIDAALAWCADHDPVRGLEIANGFGWSWIVLGDARGAHRLLNALDAAGPTRPARERATALLLAAWIEASAGDLEPARGHIAAATELANGDLDLEARCAYYLAYVESHAGEWEQALALTDRARELYDTLDRPWDQAANALFAARAAISAGDVVRAAQARDQVQRWLEIVDDPWLHVRRDAVLGELARVERRFDDAVTHLARAVETSRRLGFQQTEAYQLTSLGRAQCQAGDYGPGAATLELGIAKAEATGDVRLAALGRIHLGRILRAFGRTDEARAALEAAAAFHQTAGGGEQQVLGDTLLAALDRNREDLAALLAQARRDGNAAAEVFALDALAGLTDDDDLYAAADVRMETASHFITERDRVDRRAD